MRNLLLSTLLSLLIPFTASALDMSGVKAYPVPWRPAVDPDLTIDLTNPIGSTFKIEIFDIKGDLVYSNSYSTGLVYWSGKNRNGRPVSPGLYILKITAEKDDGSGIGIKTQRILVVR